MIWFAQYLRGLASDGGLVTIDESADVPPDVVAADAGELHLHHLGDTDRFLRADGVGKWDTASRTASGRSQAVVRLTSDPDERECRCRHRKPRPHAYIDATVIVQRGSVAE